MGSPPAAAPTSTDQTRSTPRSRSRSGAGRITSTPATASTAVFWAEDAAAARGLLDKHRADLASPAVFWIAYPKGNKSDINRDSLWPIVADYDMRPCGQVAIDERWSGLRFRPNREGEGRFTGAAT